MKPKLRVWVTFGEDLKFGDGRARLLELIDARGSLKKAAQELEMSYRNAWGYLRDLETAAGFKFVERVPGAGPTAACASPGPGSASSSATRSSGAASTRRPPAVRPRLRRVSVEPKYST